MSALNNYFCRIRGMLNKTIFFVAGTEKSGTTWLQMMLNKHPQVACKGEGQFGTRLWPGLRKSLEDYNSFIVNINAKVFSEIEQFPVFHERSIRAVQAFASAVLMSEYGDDQEIRAVGEKTPSHVRTLTRIKTLFPNAKLIFIIRDGRDIAVSGWYHLKRQHGEDKAGVLADYAKRISKIWRSDYEKVIEFCRIYPNDFINVRYEDLHNNPLQEMLRLFRYLGVDDKDEIVEECVDACKFIQLSGGRDRGDQNTQSFFRKGIVGDWRNHFDRQMWSAFDAEAGDLLSRLGYQREWIEVTENSGRLFDNGTNSQGVTDELHKVESPGEDTILAKLPNLSAMKKNAFRLFKEQNWAAAVHAFEAVISSGGMDFRSWHEFGVALRNNHEPRRAVDAFKTSLKYEPVHRDSLIQHAICLKESGDMDGCTSAYQTLIELHPYDAVAWRYYGIHLKDLRLLSEAITAFRKSLELSENIPTHNALVIALYEAGRKDEAIIEGQDLLVKKDLRAAKCFQKSKYGALNLSNFRKDFDYEKPYRNIIAFSLWGDIPAYIHGAIVNAQIAPYIFYGWRARFYCDNSVPADAVVELRRLGAEVVYIENVKLRHSRSLWRFLVSDDTNVDFFICRDADSRLNAQELLAVEAWLKSGKPFHIMRDHIYHMELILAGMWGGIAGVLPRLSDIIMSNSRYTKNKFSDQLFLAEVVWPLIKNHALTHDSYYNLPGTEKFPQGYRLPGLIHVGGAIKSMPHWRRSI